MDHGTAGPDRLRLFAAALHRRLTSAPHWLIRTYVLILSAISRNLLSHRNQQRVRNAMARLPWPPLAFAPRSIVLGHSVEVRLVPHLGEFDEHALYSRHIDYERAVFRWLEPQASQYDLIVEIGANVGIYTVFFDTLRRRRPEREQLIVSFEPSPEAYRRLQRNLRINGVTTKAVPAAVGTEAGQRVFYEPAGRLTNGSLVRAFPAYFTEAINETVVEVVAARDLEQWLAPARKALIKLDVEGFEPELLAALAPLLEKYRPDLLIEVMPSTAEALEANATLARYDRSLITAEGLRPEKAFYFAPPYFDWFLTWSRPADA